jgi:methionyl-tRNA synthetase
VKELDKLLNISYDDFIRTTDKKRHWPGVRFVWQKMTQKGDLYKSKYQGHYCSGCEAYLSEKELIDGKCIYHKQKPEFLDEENYFFRLSQYSDKLAKLIKGNKVKIVPASRKNEVLNIIKSGLKDISFSRSKAVLPWGIPVPGDDQQVIYVWCDALANYVSALGCGSKNLKKFRKYWPADLHIIGKDNLKFHALYWPAMLMSIGLPMPKKIYVHGFVTAGGQKMSKSSGNIADPFKMIKKYGLDPLRFYLLKEMPAYEDGDFTEEKFRERYNSDLANGLGNFSARVLVLTDKTRIQDTSVEKEIAKKIEQTKNQVDRKLEDFKFNEALIEVWKLISFGDGYINKKKPWQFLPQDLRFQTSIFNLLVILDNVAALLKIFLPETSEKITKTIKWVDKKTLKIKKIKPLFPRLS